MIQSIGIDAVDINRFAHWHTFSAKQLTRIFSHEEIMYCLSIPTKSAERFAARFAAREACYKILTSLCVRTLPFLTACKYITIQKQNSAPHVTIDWHALHTNGYIAHIPSYNIHLSLTHTQTTALAVVIVEY